jgi:predicted lysophospholipase L1 biosynthesis ABC-type transport system permease subunit
MSARIDLGQAWRLARRELRGGLHGFGVFLGCLFLGVFAISAIGSFTAAAARGCWPMPGHCSAAISRCG